MTSDFMRRQKTKESESTASDVKMKRMSAIERSETTKDLSSNGNLMRRNNSFIDSRNFLETPGRRSSTTSNGSAAWNDFTSSLHESSSARKPPPSVSPRSSLRRTKDTDSSTTLINGNGKINPLRSSASLSNMKSTEEIINTNNIRRVQEKSNKFLEQLSQKESPKKKILSSASSSSIPTKILEAVATQPIEGQKQNHKLALEDIKKSLARETHKRHFLKIRKVNDKKKANKFMQINDVYVSKASLININQIHKVRTRDQREYHVRVKFNEIIPDGVIEIHPVLAKVINKLINRFKN